MLLSIPIWGDWMGILALVFEDGTLRIGLPRRAGLYVAWVLLCIV